MIGKRTAKRLGRQAVSLASVLSGYCMLVQLFRTNGGGRILCYHSISDSPTNSFAVSTYDFQRQMQFLAERFDVVPMNELVERLRRGKGLSKQTVAVTIDDGYEDVYTHAYPILKKLSIPFAVFLPTGFIGERFNPQALNVLPQSRFLLWNEVREMSSNGVAFGSHSVSHIPLTRLSLDELQRQLRDSKARVEIETGRLATGFSYPYGRFCDFDSRVESVVRAAGYKWAVTGISGVNTQGSDPFALRRTKVERYDGLRLFARSMRGALDLWLLVDMLSGARSARYPDVRSSHITGASQFSAAGRCQKGDKK